MFFQDFFSAFDRTALSVAGSFLLASFLIAFIASECRHRFGRHRHIPVLRLTESRTEICLGWFRFGRANRTATLTAEGLSLMNPNGVGKVPSSTVRVDEAKWR